MYEEFYGLKEKPFSLTPDPKYLYLSPRHREAMEHLAYGIDQREGFILITGGIGTGKTTICRALVSRMNKDASVALLLNPFFSIEELLQYILKDFGAAPAGKTRLALMEELNRFLLRHAAKGGVSVLIIDEAQNLSPQVLEQIRILSNLETEKEKLLQITLVGQAELREKLKLPELRQLDQRITVRYHIEPLEPKDIPLYIYHRLAVAGSEGKISFSKMAMMKIGKQFSRGIPRLINMICDRALLNGYSRQKYHINARMIVEAAQSLRDEKKAVFIPSKPLKATVAVLLLGLVLIVGWFFYHSMMPDQGSRPLSSPITKQKNPPQDSQEKTPSLPVQHPPPEAVKETAGVQAYIVDAALPYTLHIASFRTRKQALKKIKELQTFKPPIYISNSNIPGKGFWYRVLIGKFKTPEEALAVRRELKDKNGLGFIQLMQVISENQEGNGG